VDAVLDFHFGFHVLDQSLLLSAEGCDDGCGSSERSLPYLVEFDATRVLRAGE